MLVDHTNIIADRYDAIGRDAVHKFFTASATESIYAYEHQRRVVNCEAFIAGLRAYCPDAPLDKYLNDKGKAIEAYKPAK